MRANYNALGVFIILTVFRIRIIVARYHNDNSYHQRKHPGLQKRTIQQQVDGDVLYFSSATLTTDTDPIRNRDVFQEKYLVLDAATGIRYNPYSKHHPGRHVCGSQRIQPVSEKIIPKSTRSFMQPCENKSRCSEAKSNDRSFLKDSKPVRQQFLFECCPGWSQISSKSYGCNKPICAPSCENGGTCGKPNICSCLPGFTGKSCETDINECEIGKPCDHICYNSIGSFECQCKENFALQSDGQSCIKDADDLAIETDHFEYHMLDERLQKLELILNSSKPLDDMVEKMQQMNAKYDKELNAVKKKMTSLESFYIGDLSQLKEKLSHLERKTLKIDELAIKYDKIKRCGLYSKKCG